MKKLKILLLGFPEVFGNGVFFTLDLGKDAFDFDFGRGVRGFVEDFLDDIVDKGVGRVPLGGVGGLPVDGFTGASADGLEFSRGFRNISRIIPLILFACAVMRSGKGGKRRQRSESLVSDRLH